jgi:hypothetical protein
MATFFALGLEKAMIYSTHRWFHTATVKFWSFVADQQFSLPQADDLRRATTDDARRSIVRDQISAALSRWESVEISHIPDRHTFQFGDTGRILYQAASIPMTLDWVMFVIDDKRDVRKLGTDLGAYFTDEKVGTVATAIIEVLGYAVNPAVAAGILLAKEVMKGITYFMKNDEDDQLAVVEQSFIRPRDYPTGKKHGVGVQDLSGNMWYDYFIYGMEGA